VAGTGNICSCHTCGEEPLLLTSDGWTAELPTVHRKAFYKAKTSLAQCVSAAEDEKAWYNVIGSPVILNSFIAL
jgi:hypothetical protein